MNDRRRLLGAAGERLATALLQSKGYTILERNARTARGELDIVARTPAGVVVFVEVRTRRGPDAAQAAVDSVGIRKQRRLAELASAYLAKDQADVDARIDVITIAVADDGTVLSVRHLENAVEG
ncbi:MAG: YraN family protein [Dehalococcoidia bacterium]